MDERDPSPRRFPALREASFLPLAAAVGLVGGAVACALRMAIQALSRLAFGFGRDGDILAASFHLGPLWRLAVPALGGLLAGAVSGIAARQRGGHGIPEIMEAVTLRRGVVSLRATTTKALAGILAISSGGSVGREGPLVQLAAAIGSKVGIGLRLSERQVRVLVAAGCAAGLAAAYDAPIGAVIFVAEIVAGSFALELLVPVIAASALATMVTRTWIGAAPIFRVPAFQLASWVDLGAHALVGLLAGCVGHVFLRALALGERTFARLALPRALAGALGGLLVGTIGLVFPEVFGNGFEATSRVLEGSTPWALLALVLAAKIVATTITVSSGMPGGVFTPTLLVGACLGALTGNVFHGVAPQLVAGPGSFALVGMGAALAATTHAPVLSTIMVFEISGDYAIVLPLLLATGLSVSVSRLLSPRSVYTRELARRGVPWEGSIEERLARAVTARDLASPDAVLLEPSAPFAEVRRIFRETRARSLFVGDGRAGLLGAIDLHAVKLHLDDTELDTAVVAADLAAPTEVASPEDTLLDLSAKMHRLDFGDLPVVQGSPFQLLGAITRRDLMAAFDREILKRDLLVTKIVWREGGRLASELLELPAGARIAEIRVPASLAGHPLRDARIRETEGVNVIAVIRPAHSRRETRCRLPEPEMVLERGDRLVVLVPGRAA